MGTIVTKNKMTRQIKKIYNDKVSKICELLKIDLPELVISYKKTNEDGALTMGTSACKYILNKERTIIGVVPLNIEVYPDNNLEILNTWGIKYTEEIFLTLVTITLIHEAFHHHQFFYQYEKFIGKNFDELFTTNKEQTDKIEYDAYIYAYTYINKNFKGELTQAINKLFLLNGLVLIKAKEADDAEKVATELKSLAETISKLNE